MGGNQGVFDCSVNYDQILIEAVLKKPAWISLCNKEKGEKSKM